MEEQRIKQDIIHIGKNIRRVRKEKKIGQTELAIKMQLFGIDITRETIVKIEREIRHINASELRAIKIILETSYDELLKTDKNE